jgi:hypothetical protein
MQLSVVESLHGQHYIHCDIKPENFMICIEEAVLHEKTSITAEELCEGLPAPFIGFITHVHSLGFDKELDYPYLHSIPSQTHSAWKP